jgi:fatty acid synthase subunit alpha
MDGLYSESKMGCESLVNKWQSEGWSNYLSICACKIGWTRSALMWQNNIVAQGIEEMGCRTFSTLEQAYNLVGLMHPSMVQKAAQAPLWLDTTGGCQTIKDLKGASAQLRAAVYAEAAVKKALFLEPAVTPATAAKPSPAAALVRPPKASAMANLTAFYQAFPKLPSVRKRTIFCDAIVH